MLKKLCMSSEEPKRAIDIDGLSDISDSSDDRLEAVDDLATLLLETRAQDQCMATPKLPDVSPQESDAPPTTEDFIRNYLVSNGMKRTFDCFQTEWFEQCMLGQEPQPAPAPNVYLENEKLATLTRTLADELERLRSAAEAAKHEFEKFRKQRDFHRTEHKRTVGEKSRLLSELRNVRAHYSQFEPALAELKHKYDVLIKEKFLIKLERDKLAARLSTVERETLPPKRVSILESLVPTVNSEGRKHQRGGSSDKLKSRPSKPDTPWPAVRASPAKTTDTAHNPTGYSQLKAQACGASAARVSMHPSKPLVACAQDDGAFSLFSVPMLDSVAVSKGHRSFVSACAFDPSGSLVATGSGDCTVKLWDLAEQKTRETFPVHAGPVWSVAWHSSGAFICSASQDQSARVIDIASGKMRQSIRGHVDAVNCVAFQPGSCTLATASADKTVSLWDMRNGHCLQTFYGHRNAVAHASFGSEYLLATGDADGVVKVWDLRVVRETHRIETATGGSEICGVNACVFDSSGRLIAIAGAEGVIRVFDLNTGGFTCNLVGHKGGVNDIAWTPTGLFSSGQDGTVRLWG